MSLFLNKRLSLVFCLLVSGLSLFAQDKPVAMIVDDSFLRTSIKESWLMESPGSVLAKGGIIYNLPGGGRVELRSEDAGNEFMVIIARELSGNFPVWSQGSWSLTRNKATGVPVRIRIFLRSDPYTYVQFKPLDKDRSQMEVALYDAFVVRSLPLPVNMERLYTMPLNEVLKLAGGKFPSRYFESNPQDYREQRIFISKVRENLPQLNYIDDGAIDQNGNYVYIKTGGIQEGEQGLNCSGFAKWLIDGILMPVTGKRLDIASLKEPFGKRGSSLTDAWEELRDPFFGLDWIRNLASQTWSILRSPDFGNLNEFEVRKEPFSRLRIRRMGGVSDRAFTGFQENAGYEMEALLPLLYTLAIDEPGRIYLAAVNNEIGAPVTKENPRGRPRMRQYFHVAAFVPYFNENGVFQVAVFESAAETSINALINRYPGHFVNLVRIPL